MAIVGTNIYASGAPSTNQIVTPPLSFGANVLDVVSVSSNHATLTPNQPTLSGASRTWTAITTELDASSRHRITAFRSMATSANSGAITIDFGGQTQANAKFSFDEFSGVNILGGDNGASAIRNTAVNTNSGTQTTLVVTLAAFANAANGVYATFKKSTTTAATVGSGFTALTNDTGLFTDVIEYRTDNDTTADITWASESSITVGLAFEMISPLATTNALKYYRRIRYPGPITG